MTFRDIGEPFRIALHNLGHSVHVMVIADPRGAAPAGPPDAAVETIVASDPGLTVAAVTGLTRAHGEFLVVVDPERGYSADDVVRVLEPLLRGEADVAVGSRFPRVGGQGSSAVWTRTVLRRFLGSADPTSGLLAMARHALRGVEFAPAGSFFGLEILARTAGRRLDVAITASARNHGQWPGLEELRHVKRLADDRFGNLSRLAQFCMVGASGMLVDLCFYATFQWVLQRTSLSGMTAPGIGGSLDLAVAGALAIAIALTWNFSLNRRLTFSYARRGSIVRQYLTYALSNSLGIALSFSLRLILPAHIDFFNRHRLAAAVVGIVAATGLSFSMSRYLVFSRRSVAREQRHRADVEALDGAGAPGVGAEPATAPHILSRTTTSLSGDRY